MAAAKMRRWLAAAREVAQQSTHPNNKVGAILVSRKGRRIASAANGLAPGVHPHEDRHQDGNKSNWYECAEALTIAKAAKKGGASGSTLYVTATPCSRCAGLIVAAGIKEVVIPNEDVHITFKQKWQDSMGIGLMKLQEAGVTLIRITAG
jgi:dCMP deaminase